MGETPLEYVLREPASADDLARLLASLGRVRRHPPAETRRTFLDTFDGRLYRQGQVLEAAATRGGHRLVWREAAGPALRHCDAPLPRFAWDLPPGPFRRRLEPLVELRALLPAASAVTRAEALELLDGDDKVVCRVLREEHRVGSAEAALPARVRVEPVRGYPKPARRVAGRLGEHPGLEPAAGGVFEAACAAEGRNPRGVTFDLRVELDPARPAAEAVRPVLLRLLDTLEANQPGARADLDSEFLHDLRVAVRRTRAALGQLKGVLPPEALERFRPEFAWLGSVTGPTRDLDVYLLELPAYRAALPEEHRPDLDPLLPFLRARQRREQRALARALGSRRYRQLVGGWRAFLEAAPEPSADRPGAARPVAEVVDRRTRKAWRRALREGGAIGDASPPQALHDLRKTCKKLRYLLELFQGLYPPRELGRLVKLLKGLQDHLGEFQDLEVHAGALQGFARELETGGAASPATHRALGMLVERLRHRQAEVRGEFAERFGAFAAPAARRRFEALLAPGADGGKP
ncbi:MAG: CYTH and CHAD domain-containing protein [Deferrisomatales bacterium]